LLAYLGVCAAGYMVMRSRGEMAVNAPLSGSIGHYASSDLGHLAVFVPGLIYASEMISVFPADVTACGTYMGCSLPDVPRWI
ncbi:proline-specific permease ProY, partial [Pseudomonas aeruginosa]